jgi:hypothetical protein
MVHMIIQQTASLSLSLAAYFTHSLIHSSIRHLPSPFAG